MKTLVAGQTTLQFDRLTIASRLLSLVRDFAASRLAAFATSCVTAINSRQLPAPAAAASAPGLDKVWGHTVKRAQQGSPIHRQTLALLDRDDRLAIEAVCGSWCA